jgi:hypothetical protein
MRNSLLKFSVLGKINFVSWGSVLTLCLCLSHVTAKLEKAKQVLAPWEMTEGLLNDFLCNSSGIKILLPIG